VSPGEARRALDVTWQFFIRKGALAEGNVTQGYFGADRRLLENYSGPASCLWSLRSLIAAFSMPENSPVWRTPAEPLPVERSDFERRLSQPAWLLVGNRQSASVTIHTASSADPPLEDQRGFDRVAEWITRKPRRPKNEAAKYSRARYGSRTPFGMKP